MNSVQLVGKGKVDDLGKGKVEDLDPVETTDGDSGSTIGTTGYSLPERKIMSLKTERTTEKHMHNGMGHMSS